MTAFALCASASLAVALAEAEGPPYGSDQARPVTYNGERSIDRCGLGGTMTRWALAALAACALAAGCDDGPTAPSDQPLVFTALLSPANEVPAVANAESGGRGAVQIVFTVTRSGASAITGATADFYFQLSGFPGGTTAVGAHIHPGIAGVNGPVVVSTGLAASAPFALTNGGGEYRASGIPVDAALAQAIINNPAGYYFNVHSPLNAGGFARGQLTRVQ